MALGWTISIIFGLYSVFGLYDYARTGEISSTHRILYTLFGRNAYVISIAWITFACATGYGGFFFHILFILFGIMKSSSVVISRIFFAIFRNKGILSQNLPMEHFVIKESKSFLALIITVKIYDWLNMARHKIFFTY